jgi:ADP-ribose pyrophosphatase YjhB (NUDIX family)
MFDGKMRSFSHYVTSKRDKKAETTYKVGAKVFVMYNKQLVMFKDADTGVVNYKKPWDHLGGKTAENIVEIPIETGIRELKEEAGLVRTIANLHFVGITDESDDQGRSIWRSFVYLTMITEQEFSQMQQFVKDHKRIKGSEFMLTSSLQVPEGSQPWVERHNRLFVQKCGFLGDAWRALIAHDNVFMRVPCYPEDSPYIRNLIMSSYVNCNMDAYVPASLLVKGRKMDIFQLKRGLAYFGLDIPASPNNYFYVSRGKVELTDKAEKACQKVASREREFYDYVGDRIVEEDPRQ